MRTLISVSLALVFLAVGSGLALAQAPGWQTVSDPSGYQFLAPANWQLYPSSSVPTGQFLVTNSSGPDAYAFSLTETLPSDLQGAAIEDALAQAVASGTLKSHGSQTSYSVTSAATPVTVSGADRSLEGIATYLDKNGQQMVEYDLVAIRSDYRGYVLSVQVPLTYDSQYPYISKDIVASFQITPATSNAITAGSTSAAAPPSITTTIGTLLQSNGSGDRQTSTFSTSGGQVQVCWNVSGRSPSAGLGPDVGFFIEPAGSGSYGNNFDVNDVEQNCSYAHLDPGTYYVKVIATSWSQWSITVTGS